MNIQTVAKVGEACSFCTAYVERVTEVSGDGLRVRFCAKCLAELAGDDAQLQAEALKRSVSAGDIGLHKALDMVDGIYSESIGKKKYAVERELVTLYHSAHTYKHPEYV